MSTSGYQFEQYFATRRILGFQPSPDGSRVYFLADVSGQWNLWRVSSEGGWPEQLTLFSRESVRDLCQSKDGRKLAFIADPDGNEMFQVYVMDADHGWPEQLTHDDGVQYQLAGFSPDGRYLAYSGNAAVPSDVDIYLRDLETGAVRQISEGGRLMFGASFSPDGRYLLAQQSYSNTDGDLWLYDLAAGQGRNLTAHPGSQAKFEPLFWSKDGKGFYYLSDEGREFLAIGYCEAESGRRSYVVTADWDIETCGLSGDGTRLAYVVNEAGNSALKMLNLTTGQEMPVPPLPVCVIGDIKFAGKDPQQRLFLSMARYNHANAVHVLDLAEGALRLLTPAMLGNIPAEAFVAPELVRIESFDGQQVPAWLYKPVGAAPDAPVPAVLSIHGGPEAQERAGYNYTGYYQYLLSQGIAILAPNIRGSTGFGIKYQKAIHRDWGGAELRDIEACAQYLQSLEWVDPKRIAVWGGSFGGFATLSAVTRLPGYWACGCDFCGPANLVTFARSVPPHWKPIMKSWVGDPDEDHAMLMERSPISYVDDIRCPLMVVQGANDPRVVKAESDQMVDRLRQMGREVEYLVFDDEGHGFAKRPNQLKGYKAMADFLVRHLL